MILILGLMGYGFISWLEELHRPPGPLTTWDEELEAKIREIPGTACRIVQTERIKRGNYLVVFDRSILQVRGRRVALRLVILNSESLVNPFEQPVYDNGNVTTRLVRITAAGNYTFDNLKREGIFVDYSCEDGLAAALQYEEVWKLIELHLNPRSDPRVFNLGRG
ncbi:hypothetical protein HY358_00700 [Candidatus Roizmanbacteria bacterium]|nr:hypothetical protein [Candidatus Roizmanbacteria bacterium]